VGNLCADIHEIDLVMILIAYLIGNHLPEAAI
jgi:hypothetical protein